MDENGRRELDLLLLALDQGILSGEQVEECLRERERAPGGSPVQLCAVAVKKGFLSQERLSDLAARPGPSALGAPDLRILMVCRDCKAERRLSVEAALKHPPCPACSGALVFGRRPGSSPGKAYGSPAPEEVRQAQADPKNRFSKYVLLSKLGTGGMGEVWRAWDTVLNRMVALKFPKTAGEDEIRRLYLEAQGAGGLSHPHIASIYEIAEAEARHYIAMQFIPGQTAEERAQAEKVPTREIVRWVRDAARGVHYAHEGGVIHRDLKPANVMIDTEGRVFVMDFGLAKLAGGEGSATVSGAILGTPAFMPPEQAAANAGQVDRRSDVYSLGAMLYVLLAGKRPFEGDSATDILVQILTREPTPLREAWPETPWELEAIVTRAMARARDERYSTAKDFADDLDRYLANQPIEAKRQGPLQSLGRIIRRQGRMGAAVALCLALLAGAAVFSLRPPRRPPPAPAGPDRLKEWAGLFEQLRAALAVETFDGQAAGPLVERLERDFPEQKPGVDLYLESQGSVVERALQSLPRSEWLDSAPRVRKYRDWLRFAKKPTAEADRILNYRGSFSLTIQVAPYAELRGAYFDGLPPEERVTPLALKDLEIQDGGIELVHPEFGTHAVRLPALHPGSLITIEGNLSDPRTLQPREGP